MKMTDLRCATRQLITGGVGGGGGSGGPFVRRVRRIEPDAQSPAGKVDYAVDWTTLAARAREREKEPG